MDRRNFLKNSLAVGIAAGIGITNNDTVFANSQNYDLVIAKDGTPEQMFDKAIASMGEMSRFVKKGQTVVVKPNIGWDVSPERAGNTNPGLVKKIIEHCYKAGAKEVHVFDNTCDNWKECYEHSGIKKAALQAGAKVHSGSSQKNYRKVKINNAKILKEALVHELILDSDVFINVPILKHHSSGKITVAMKNLMGVVWDRRWWHANNLHQCIADFCNFKKPDLNIVDAYRCMMQNGPRGISINDVETKKFLIISKDIVAIDAAAAKVFGIAPNDVPYIKYAHSMGIGTMDLEKLKINRIKI